MQLLCQHTMPLLGREPGKVIYGNRLCLNSELYDNYHSVIFQLCYLTPGFNLTDTFLTRTVSSRKNLLLTHSIIYRFDCVKKLDPKTM